MSRAAGRDGRRAERLAVRDGVAVQVNRQAALLVDVSPLGAQVLSGSALRPGQSVRVSMDAGIQIEAFVAWAACELTRDTGGARYRAGVSFVGDHERVAGFYARVTPAAPRRAAPPSASETPPADREPIRDASSPAPRPRRAPVRRIRGARRAERRPMRDGVTLQLNGTPATLVDLSAVGAQVVSSTILRPGQRVSMSLGDDVATRRCAATVSWASYESWRDQGAAGFRAGVEFLGADHQWLADFVERNQRATESPADPAPAAPPRAGSGPDPRQPPDPYARGQRRADRVTVRRAVVVEVEGTAARLLDVSAVGAQLLARRILEPGEVVTVGLADAFAQLRLPAVVVWASTNPVDGEALSPYRAGVDFLDVNHEVVAAFCRRNAAAAADPEPAPAVQAPAAAVPVAEHPAVSGGRAPDPTPDDWDDPDPDAVVIDLDIDALQEPDDPAVDPPPPADAGRSSAAPPAVERPPTPVSPRLRDLPAGTAILVTHRKREVVVVLQRVKRIRFLAARPDGRVLDLPIDRFVRVAAGAAPSGAPGVLSGAGRAPSPRDERRSGRSSRTDRSSGWR